MISVYLRLDVGHLKKGTFVVFDSYELDIGESINAILNSDLSSEKYAELRLNVAGLKEPGSLIGSFKKIKLKNKGYKWILVD